MEASGVVKQSTYNTLNALDVSFENLKPVLLSTGYFKNLPAVDALVITSEKEAGAFVITRSQKKLIHISKLRKFSHRLGVTLAHEYGHLLHYELEDYYGEGTINSLINSINSTLNTTKIYYENSCNNEVLFSMYNYSNKTDEVFARMVESLYCNTFNINHGMFVHVIYTQEEVTYFFDTLLNALPY